MTTPEASENQLPRKVESLMKGQRLLETTGGFFKMVTWGGMLHSSGEGGGGALECALISQFAQVWENNIVCSLASFALSMYLTALQGILFLFPPRNRYTVFSATIHPVQAKVETE